MKVLVIEPMKAPYESEIPNTLAALQKIVGGTIQALYPYPDEVALICHDEGKLLGLPSNRRRIEDYDIIAGTFCIVGLSEDNFESLSPTLLLQYKEKFDALELYIPLHD